MDLAHDSDLVVSGLGINSAVIMTSIQHFRISPNPIPFPIRIISLFEPHRRLNHLISLNK